MINDISDKSPAREILLLWSAYRRDGTLPAGELQRFRTHFAPWFAEFTAAEHPADEAYLRDIESEHPTPAAQARELWLQTENLWALWPVFIEALRTAGVDCKIMVGGAVLTPDYAKMIGADYYVRDAKCSADVARQIFD